MIRVINSIEGHTDFRFLYRDALISDIRLSFSSTAPVLWKDFNHELIPHGLTLKVDSTRKQVIVYQQVHPKKTKREISIRGQVVDASTGERLPFATISWKENNLTEGVSSNESGAFRISRAPNQNIIDIRCSYVGYSSKKIHLNLSDASNLRELTFRLQPERIDGNQVIITGTNYYSNITEETSGIVDIGTFSPMGETNTLRALQTLPSVSLAPALSDGLHVRGSPTDGFQVLLDNITVYNQSHLFGLADSFNADILQRSGFFYDIAPAQYQAPPGGTLSLFTKTGSLNELSGSMGLTNSSFRISLEGPIKKGKSSWLISGRKSYMNTVDWFNNSELVKWGLDVDRQQDALDQGLIDFQSRLVRPRNTDASFFDLHAKAYFEGDNGNRFILSGYWGGDNTLQQSNRLFRTFSSTGRRFEPRLVSSANEWYNGALSTQYQQWLNSNIYSSTTAGISIYQTEFSKEDFNYIEVNQANRSLQSFIFPFENKSVLNEIKFEEKLELNSDPWLWTAGAAYYYYIGEYFEDSFERPGFLSSQRSHKLDIYLQLDFSGLDFLDLFAGNRVHYYSNGNYLKWSPRIKLTLFPQSKISLSGGFSRNYQFLNQISLSNTVTSNIWILSSEDQPPTSVDYYSAGIHFSLSKYMYAQAEGYYKEFSNVRLHEINAYSLSNTFNSNPWYIHNDENAQGIEFLLRNPFRFLSLTQTFTISEVTLSNPAIGNGDPFYADWDRTYRYGATLSINPVPDFTLYLSWLYATGTPNKLAIFGPEDEQRLGDYQRGDISAEYSHQFSGSSINVSATIFNVLNRQNPWYRELTFVIDRNGSHSRFSSVPVNVYDIGFQPSFNISVAF